MHTANQRVILQQLEVMKQEQTAEHISGITMADLYRREGVEVMVSPGKALAIALICLLSMIFLPFEAAALLVDRVIASVNNEVITWSDLRRAVAFNEALSSTAQDKKVLEAETLEGLINRKLVLLEARRFTLVEVTEEDINKEREVLKKHFGSAEKFFNFIVALDMDMRSLGRMLGERLLVERFMEKKIGLFVRVSREEAQTYFDQHSHEFQGKRFQMVYPSIVNRLTNEKAEKQIEKYLAELRSRADVRINPL